MYRAIAVPVDLAHADKLEKALKVAADFAKLYSIDIFLLGVTASAPSSVAHNPAEFKDKLASYAEAKSQQFGVAFHGVAIPCPDPIAELDEALSEWIHNNPADLVVMASHIPSFKDYLFRSNGGYLASHTDKSVFIVR